MVEGRPRFLADCNVGKLARWLRALGYDATYHARIGDAELVAQALAQGRVLLTRDADLMQRRPVASGALRTILLRSDRLEAQLRQVKEDLGLDDGQALTRCLECNAELEPRDLADVAERVPPHVRATQVRYSECPVCSRVYWAGTHWARMREVMGGL